MARRKKSTKKAAPRRRRRMGAASKSNSPLMNMLYAAGGVIGANMLVKVLPDSLDDKIKAGALAAAGFLIPSYLLKNQMGAFIGAGVGGAGLYKLGQSFGIISGVGMGGTPMIAGYRNITRQLSGMAGPTPMIAGTPMVAGAKTDGYNGAADLLKWAER